MKLYNTKTLKIEKFTPIIPNEVSMYVCGPTVYGHAHIGNVRPMIVFDTLKRVLEANNYKVKYVSNFTDVDDKIIKKALEENVSENIISERYIEAYQELRTKLNATSLYKTPRVTDNINDIIKYIEDLIKNGNAYVSNGDVYFDVLSIDNYGSLSKQNIDDLKVGARIEENTHKKNPMDFALWKKTETGIKWETSFSEGRPGWHTECVVMIHKELGNHIDIHGGGSDLKFPHHENECAQQQALCNNSLANYWVHNAMINVDGDKMSKSLGNVVNAKDIINKLGSQLVRFFMLSTHYRKELNFTNEAIETARKELEKINNTLKQTNIILERNNIKLDDTYDKESYNEFINTMNDDLNTPNAFTTIFDTTKKLNGAIRQREKDYTCIMSLYKSLFKMLDILGIEPNTITLSDSDREDFELWEQAKTNKDFEVADIYRDKLIKKGLI